MSQTGKPISLDIERVYPESCLSSVIADALLLYRCYVIWDRNIRVVLGPVILLIAATGILFSFSLSPNLGP